MKNISALGENLRNRIPCSANNFDQFPENLISVSDEEKKKNEVKVSGQVEPG